MNPSRLAVLAPGATVSDYVNGASDWDTNPAATSMFGACLRAVINATATWAVAGTCAAIDGPAWRSIPRVRDATAVVATAANGQSASAQLRFGLRPALTAAPDQFAAPITYEVLAPNA